MINKILSKFGIVVVTIIIFLVTFLIGVPMIQENNIIIYFSINFIGILYYIYLIYKKEKIITNKLDIFMIVLFLSTFIPLIFKTYTTLFGTVYTIFEYLAILNMYFIFKKECRQNKKIIINLVILSVMILCFIGIDGYFDNKLENLKSFLNYNRITYDENRIVSLFSYPNTMAIVACVGIFLTLDRIINEKGKIKIIYVLCAIIMAITLFLTYSRLVYIVFAFGVCMFLLYSFICTDSQKINKRKIAKVSVIIFIMLCVYIVIALNIGTNLEVEDEYQKIFYSMNSSSSYDFKFTFTSDNVRIKIVEKDMYFDDVKVTEEEYSNLESEQIDILVETTSSTSVIYLYIYNLDENSQTIVYNLDINGENVILNYLLLPTKVVNKIESISLKNKSAWERFVFISDALELIFDNVLFGYGGNAWEYLQAQVQEYNYYAREVHCFIIQNFLEFGIVAFIAWCAIILYITVKSYKKLKTSNECSCIIFSLMLLLLHSLLDFDMSFMYVNMLFVILINTILSDEKEEIILKDKNENIFKICIMSFSLVSCIFLGIKLKYNLDQVRILKSDYNTKISIVEKYLSILPFDEEIKEDIIELYLENEEENKEKIEELVYDLITNESYLDENINLNNVVKYIDFSEELSTEDVENILNYIYKTAGIKKYYPSIMIQRWENMKSIIQNTDSNILKQQILDVLKDEVYTYKEDVTDINKTREEDELESYYKIQVKNIESYVNSMYQ